MVDDSVSNDYEKRNRRIYGPWMVSQRDKQNFYKYLEEFSVTFARKILARKTVLFIIYNN